MATGVIPYPRQCSDRRRTEWLSLTLPWGYGHKATFTGLEEWVLNMHHAFLPFFLLVWFSFLGFLLSSLSKQRFSNKTLIAPFRSWLMEYSVSNIFLLRDVAQQAVCWTLWLALLLFSLLFQDLVYMCKQTPSPFISSAPAALSTMDCIWVGDP